MRLIIQPDPFPKNIDPKKIYFLHQPSFTGFESWGCIHKIYHDLNIYQNCSFWRFETGNGWGNHSANTHKNLETAIMAAWEHNLKVFEFDTFEEGVRYILKNLD